MEKRALFEELAIDSSNFDTYFGDSSVALFEDELLEVIEAGDEMIRSRCEIQIFSLEKLTKESFTVRGITFECGRKIAFQLRGSTDIALFVATVGDGPTVAYDAYCRANEPLKGYFADSLGSISVECAMDRWQTELASEQSEVGKRITNRYSPGYCGWALVEQAKLFGLLSPLPCGIRLTESSLMIPHKSISGVIGIGEEVRFTEHECNLCDLVHCIYRNRRKNKQR